MKVSLNWLKSYLDTDKTPDEISVILTDIGLEVEGMEEVESVPGGLKGLVIGEVKTCVQHPNADKLSLTTVNVGGEEDLQIVCGAPNVAAGQKVVVATVGTMLYPSEGEPFKIKKGKIRGEVSMGMICAEDEIGLGNSHAGIMVLPEEVAAGTEASAYFDLESDIVYEIGLTPNRSDATCHMGVAKDLVASLQINAGYEKSVILPDVSDFKEGSADPINITIEHEEACPRYAGVVIEGLEVKESPDWLKQRLTSIGIKSTNNVVDITNFILHDMGQPLHAFDLDKIGGGAIRVKTLAEGTEFVALDESKIKLRANDLMICDANDKGMCIAGVYGGLDSGVSDSTTRIFLESAHFNAGFVRVSSMKHNLRTDAAKVFEKGSDPNIVIYALKKAAMLIQEVAGGEITSKIFDHYPTKVESKEVSLKYSYINTLIGTNIPVDEMHKIMAALEMEIVKREADGFTVKIPTNKSDVTRPADVVEEILRIYGLNNVPVPQDFKMSINVGKHPDPRKVQREISSVLVGNGFNEIMGVSLKQSEVYKSVLPYTDDQLVFVNNTSNVTHDIMRPDMLLSGLMAIEHNQNRQNADLKFFEFGRSYLKEEDQFLEKQHISLFMTGMRWGESWLNTEKKKVDAFSLKAMVDSILDRFGLENLQQQQFSDERFAYAMRYHRGPQVLAEFGQVNPKIVKAMGIKSDVFYADLNWKGLVKTLKKQKIHFEQMSKFPSVRRDLALVVENSVKFSDIVQIAKRQGKKLLKSVNLFDVYRSEEQLGADKKSYAVSFIFEDASKTLKDKEITKIMDALMKDYESKLSAQIRS